MKYSEYRKNIQSGDVLAWTNRTSHKSIGSMFIRYFTQSEYHHVGLAWVCHRRVLVLEAKFPYVRIVPLSSLLPCYVIKMDNMLSNSAIERALSLVGVAKYSIPESIRSYFKINSKDDKWQCVEYVKDVLNINGTPLTCKDTPSDLVFEIQKLGKSLVYLEEG